MAKKAKLTYVLDRSPITAYLGGREISVYPLRPCIPLPPVAKVLDKFKGIDVSYISLENRVYSTSKTWTGLIWDGKTDLSKLAKEQGEIHLIGTCWVLFTCLDSVRKLVWAMVDQMNVLGFDATDQGYCDALFYCRYHSDPGGLLRALLTCWTSLSDFGSSITESLWPLVEKAEQTLRAEGVLEKLKTCSKCWGRGGISAAAVKTGMMSVLKTGDPNCLVECDLCGAPQAIRIP